MPVKRGIENPSARSSVLRTQRGRTHDQQRTEAPSKVKGSIGRQRKRHALPGVIGDDLLRFGSCHPAFAHLHHFNGGDGGHDGAPYCLPTAQREQLVLERDALDIEWRNLILKKMRSAITAGWSGSTESCKCSMLIRPKKIS